MDKNTFFREATLLITSSLEIEVSLDRCRRFICEHIPADVITLNIYNPATKTVKYLAKADPLGGEKLNLELEIPPGLVQAIEGGQRFKDDSYIIRHTKEDPMGSLMTSSLGLPQAGFIALRLVIEGQRLGVADIFSFDRDFTTEHARWFALLREPFSITIANAIKHQEIIELKDQLASENRELSRRLSASTAGEIVGADRGLRDVMVKVNQVARLKNTVLLLGETGVGKEVIANAIHHGSLRNKGPFIKVNCGAIPDTLIDSELFGHEKGAFTGAVSRKQGLFERAHKGTIFLDEIGELPLRAQVRLLRVLQTREIQRVGGTQPIPLDIRVIAATHRDLHSMVREGRFREDLFYRLNAFPIEIPPLRHRKEDIPAFVDHLLVRKSEELGINVQLAISAIDMDFLLDYDWPGNVRELDNVVERTLIQRRSGHIFSDRPVPLPTTNISPMDLPGTEDSPIFLSDVVSEHIHRVLEMTRGKINGPGGAAALLNLAPSTLRNKMNKLGILYGRQYPGNSYKKQK